MLADQDAFVLAPYLRGFGPTRFLEETTIRSGQQAALGQDLLDFMDALNIEQAVLAATTGAAGRRASRLRWTPDASPASSPSAGTTCTTSRVPANPPPRSGSEATGTSTTSTRSGGAAGWNITGTNCASCCGGPGHPPGLLQARRFLRAPRACTIPISSTSSSTPTGTATDWLTATPGTSGSRT
ncbi:hypothetical protein ACOM2C_10510 [Pseudarthrobacter sp. So.54]